MGKLQEIITSGCAPGVRSGTVDPQSVYARVPKGLSDMESEPLFRHGPARGARRIAKYFGFSADGIKKVWARPPLALLLACLMLATARAGDLTPGEVLVDGQTVHAADLNNMVSGALITQNFFTRQVVSTPSPAADFMVAYSPSGQGYLYKATVLSFMQTPALFTTLNPYYPSFTTNDLFMFYSQGNTNVQSVTFSNLVADIASNMNPASLQYAPTNANGSNVPVLPNWVGPFSGLNTNNQPISMFWGTNGIPTQVPLSNIETAVAGDLGTNYLLNYTFNQVFQPWTVYGTNTYGFTNAWGSNTNFLIASLIVTNAYNLTNTTPTLTDTDTVPILSTGQKTNTAVTLQALGQYMTNRYPDPALNYTQARVCFKNPQVANLSKYADATSHIWSSDTKAFLTTNGPTCVSFFLTLGGAFPTGSPPLATNTAYWVVPVSNSVPGTFLAPFTNTFQIFASYANAVSMTNPIPGSTGATTNGISFVPEYTAYNADVIHTFQGNATGGMTEQAGEFTVVFRTPAVTTNYYVTGSVLQNITYNNPVVSLTYQGQITTNGVGIATSGGSGTEANFTRVYILISPQ